MMREAQEMMSSPEFQEQMRKMTEHPAFKKAMEQTQKMMADPKVRQEYEEKMKKALEQGNQQLAEFEKIKSEAQKKEGEDDAAADGEGDELEVPNLNIN
jgi:uncharacterized protein YihD (DUF1040 family)